MDSTKRRPLSVREMQQEAQRRASALLAGIYADHGEKGSSEDIDLQARRDIWSEPQLKSLKQRIEEINQRRVHNWALYFEELSLMNRSQDQEKEARMKKAFLFSLRVMQDGRNSFEDIVDAYLAYLQVNVVDPAMESALGILQKFALEACDGKVPDDQLEFGAPWRHMPNTKDHQESLKWANIQLMDFVQSFINTKFGVNVVDPAMESALGILQKFALDACDGKVPDDQLEFGAPWRHMPNTKGHQESLKWAKIQLMDFVQSFINTKFGVNYLIDYGLEILDNPSAAAMLEVP